MNLPKMSITRETKKSIKLNQGLCTSRYAGSASIFLHNLMFSYRLNSN